MRYNNLYNGWVFSVRCSGVTFANCERVHPIMQMDVQLIVNMLSTHECIKKIVIFGSSISMRCTEYSDIDMFVESSGVNVYGLLDTTMLYHDVDILMPPINFEGGVGLDIKKEGVTVFER